jgi:uncharacterized protein (TIGR02246 family)
MLVFGEDDLMKMLIAKNKALWFGVVLSIWLTSVVQVRADDHLVGTSMSEDEKAIRQQAEGFAKAFSAGQADAIADLCTADCTLTDAQGERFVGRDAILKLYQRCFHDYGSNPAYVYIDSLAFPAPDVCIEEGSLFVSKVNSENRYSVVHVKHDGKWQMLRIIESPYNPKPSEAIKDLNWLVGQWTIKNGDKLVHMKIHPIANSNFLVMRFSKNLSEAYADEMQLIGWSYKSKDVVSWHFGADGGFGFGHWQRMGPNWLVNTKGVCRDGSETLAIYELERVDNDHIRWHSTNRQVAGEKLPDLPVVEVTRDK